MMGSMDSRRMCPHCRAFITDKDRVCPYCNEHVGPRAVERRMDVSILGGFIPHARFTTAMILIMNIGLFIATVLFSMKSGNNNAVMDIDMQTLFAFGAKYRPYILAGQWWRLITAGFLHGGLLHIGMNMWVLFDLGAQVEQVYGTARFLVIYFLANLVGFYSSMVFSVALSVGASAALFGLIGAMLAIGVRYRHTSAGSAIRGLYMRWVIYGVIFSFIPGVDMAAHLGGLAAGFGVGYLSGLPKLRESMGERVWQAASYACIVLTALSFLKWYLWFSHAA
jgi:rhomboid protease GluP